MSLAKYLIAQGLLKGGRALSQDEEPRSRPSDARHPAQMKENYATGLLEAPSWRQKVEDVDPVREGIYRQEMKQAQDNWPREKWNNSRDYPSWRGGVESTDPLAEMLFRKQLRDDNENSASGSFPTERMYDDVMRKGAGLFGGVLK